MTLTKQQRLALKQVARRLDVTYRTLRRQALPGPGCVMVPFAGMWLGVEPDGYTHS